MADGELRAMRLRYSDECCVCSVELPAGSFAHYDAVTRSVTCSPCVSPAAADIHIAPGVAGGSAQREFDRRRAKRVRETHEKHPKIGKFLLAIRDDPQSTKAWATGARGEEQVGRALDAISEPGLHVLHDRRIPRSRANIDHIVIAPSGVHVIDAKKYRGRPRLESTGGLFSPRVHTLFVGSRNCTSLVDGVLKQVSLVRAVLERGGYADIPTAGHLCFVDADWPMFGGAFSISDVSVTWPQKLSATLVADGVIDEPTSMAISRHLAATFPSA